VSHETAALVTPSFKSIIDKIIIIIIIIIIEKFFDQFYCFLHVGYLIIHAGCTGGIIGENFL